MGLSKKAKIALWTVGVFTFISAGLSASIAWFNTGTNAFEADVSGSVVEEYFHCGDGSQANPYVITRPIHYYHLVEFFQRTTNLPKGNDQYSHFGTDYLYFQVGYDLDGTGVKKVYDYNDLGIYQGTSEVPSYSTTLNMAYYSGKNALLPIGTNEVPFIGNFDGGKTSGGGITIANLSIHCTEDVVINNATVTRSASDIGVFGYVADSVNSTQTVIQNAYFDNLTIDLTDVASTAANSSTNVSHISTHDSNKAYVGYIAGHVHTYTNKTSSANATPLHDVYVNHAKIKGGAGVYCNYGYLGKADFIDGSTGNQISVEEEIDELAQVADGVGQGGSLNMANLYQRLLYYYRSMSGYEGSTTGFQGVFSDDTSGNYYYRVNRTIDVNGNATITSHTDSNEVLLHSYQADSEDKKLGTVCLWNRHIKGAAGSDPHNERFMYLMGGRWSNDTVTQYVPHVSSALLSIDGVNYLTVTGTGATDFTSTGEIEASPWVWNFGNSRSKISTTYGNSTVYLRNNAGSLELTTSESSATNWNVGVSGDVLSISNDKYELDYSSNQWRLAISSIGGYRLHNSTNYLSYSSASGSLSRTSEGNAPCWQWNPSKQTFVTDEATPRYLYVTRSGWLFSYTYSVSLTNNSSQAGIMTASSTPPYAGSTTLSGKYNNSGDTYYLIIGSSISVNTSTSGNAIYAEPKYVPAFTVRPKYNTTYGPGTETVNRSGMEYTSSNTSIVPLNVVKDGEFTEKVNYYTAKKNNGYLVSGSDFEASGDFKGTNAKYTPIRVSGYPIGTSLSTSYTVSTKTLHDIKTVHANGNTENLTSAEQSTDLYTKSVNALKETLSGEITAQPDNPMVYGLHFMDSSISKNRLVKSNYALINGKQKENYELPVDSIDFNLHENKGFVNFFAGSYFSNNDTFFSLNHIYRNSDDSISDLKQISKIYTDGDETHSYVYQYSDGKYSQPFAFDSSNNKKPINSDGTVDQTNPYRPSMTLSSKPSTYSSLLFDTSRFSGTRTLTSNALYYFEVPIDKGEYAVGSVSGGTGAYLVYLDVGTNGNQGNYNTDNMIGNSPLFTQIGFMSGTFVTNSVFNIGYVIPNGSDADKFSIAVSVETGVSYNQKTYTCFNLVITNSSGSPLTLNALLMDDDDNPDNEYLYMYSIVYNNGAKTYHTSSDTFTGNSGASSMTPAHETTTSD